MKTCKAGISGVISGEGKIRMMEKIVISITKLNATTGYFIIRINAVKRYQKFEPVVNELSRTKSIEEYE